MSEEKCRYCGSTHNLQKHDWAYGDKELQQKWSVIVCIACHRKIHKHGVGPCKRFRISDKDAKRVSYTIEVSDYLMEQVRSRADQNHITISQAVTDAMRLWMGKSPSW